MATIEREASIEGIAVLSEDETRRFDSVLAGEPEPVPPEMVRAFALAASVIKSDC